jgi:hypothetical protein
MDVQLAIVTAAGEQSTDNVVGDKRAVIADGSPKRARGGKKPRVITATPVRLPSKLSHFLLPSNLSFGAKSGARRGQSFEGYRA